MSTDAKAIQQIDPLAHPGALICLCLSDEQQQQLRAAASMPDAECDHVTLCYLTSDAATITAAKNNLLCWLTQIAQQTAPLDGCIGGVARFNASESSGGQDVMVALYDAPDLPDLYAAVAGAALCCGVMASDDHGFVPHITLAYLDPSQEQPVTQLPRMSLPIAALTLVWAGERIDLPLLGAGDEDMDEMKAADPGDYLVVEDKDKPSTYHLQVRRNGTPDHRLMGAAWAALHGGYRGNTYDGPNKQAAIARLRALYQQEKMPLPTKAMGTGSMAAGAALIPDEPESPQEAARETPADEEKEDICPECGARMVTGTCPNCGYVAAKAASDAMIWSQPAVKSLPAPDPSNPYVIRKYLVIWGGKDLMGDTFERDTDLGLGRNVKGMPVYYEHTQRGIKSQVGRVIGEEEDDGYGLSVPIELERSRSYVKQVLELDHQDALGSSSGAVGHTVIRRNGKLKRWVIGELSLTPTPMEPRTHPAFAGKSLAQEDSTMGDTQPTQEAQPGADIARLEGEVKSLKTALEQAQAALNGKADTAVVQSVRSDLDEIRSMPAVKGRSPQAAAEALGGAIGGGLNARADDPPNGYHYFKALTSISHPGSPTRQAMYPEGVFGGFVKAVFMSNKPNQAVARDALKALDEMYGASCETEAAKSLGTQAGVSGAYSIPEQFLPTLMAIARQNDVFYGRTMVIPADGGEIVIPALDPSTAFSEGQSAYYGGVTVTWSNDDASPTLTQPVFKQLRLKTNALKASTRVANQLMLRSAVAIDAVVSNLLGAAIGRARDYACIRGTGQGQPLGFINAPSAIDQGGSSIDFATLSAMEDNVIPERDDNYVWIIHSKKRSSIWALQQTNNTLVTLLPNLRDRPTTTLLGRPISWTDKTPFASGDISNTVNLVDPSMYVVAEFQGIALAVSDQARFEQDETVIRAILSVDGQPWLTNKVAVTSTPDYVSGFVTI